MDTAKQSVIAAEVLHRIEELYAPLVASRVLACRERQARALDMPKQSVETPTALPRIHTRQITTQSVAASPGCVEIPSRAICIAAVAPLPSAS